MKVAGFTIIKNAIKFDYPVVEAITSILPLCDEFVVAVGDSEDDTLQLIQSIGSPKIKIINTIWDSSKREGGAVLADETNKAFDAVSEDMDWAFYIQSDEVVHEQYHQAIKMALLKWKDNERVEGLLFNYTHFYGSYDYIGDSRRWYRNEIRIIRNDKRIRSYRDAQGFRKEGKKLKVKSIDASIYHYGWVKHPKDQQEKQKSFHKMWHDDEWVNKKVSEHEFDYQNIDALTKFEGTHPKVMQERIDRINWKFDFDPSKRNRSLKMVFLMAIEKLTGWRAGEYKNYKVI